VQQHLGAQVPDMVAEFQDVTFVELFQHRSGLPANLGLWATMSLSGAGRDVRADRVAAARSVLTGAPEGPRGTFLYSNAGYVVAGAMIETVMDARWEGLIEDHVFTPLGMDSAGFGAPAGDDPVLGHKPGLFSGLTPVPPGPDADNIPALGPAGTVHLSMADMLRYLAAHASRSAFLTPESWDRLHIPPETGEAYAMGWRKREDASLWHNGSNTFWYAAVAFDPATSRAAAVFTNSGDIGTMRPLADAAIDAALRV
jgi:D-alanyl-D-alanine carboxypeptidase